MVKGLERFSTFFSEYTDQYVLIGGAACDISFYANDVSFRATRDLDIVLIVEALTKKKEQGIHVDSKDIKKHRNDILRIVSELVLEPCTLSDKVKDDMREFTDRLQMTDADLKNLKIVGVKADDIKRVLRETYFLE